jgi:hypothetical protein
LIPPGGGEISLQLMAARRVQFELTCYLSDNSVPVIEGAADAPIAPPLRIVEKFGGRDRVRTCDPLLAKQVLSQLSYTPKPTLFFILNQLRILAPLETAQTVSNGVFISFACRSSFSSASLYICEYFLKT